MNLINALYIVVLIISVVIHEVAHGYAADTLGDPTARIKGRLSLNPLVHIDPFGSIILPLLLFVTGAPFMLGWAKPVPFNPYNLRNRKWGGALVALAGPLSNLLVAGILGVVLYFGLLPLGAINFVHIVILTNVALAIFNLVPIPPLDGHHILFALLPNSLIKIKQILTQYGFILVLIFVMFGWKLIEPLITYLYNLLT